MSAAKQRDPIRVPQTHLPSSSETHKRCLHPTPPISPTPAAPSCAPGVPHLLHLHPPPQALGDALGTSLELMSSLQCSHCPHSPGTIQALMQRAEHQSGRRWRRRGDPRSPIPPSLPPFPLTGSCMGSRSKQLKHLGRHQTAEGEEAKRALEGHLAGCGSRGMEVMPIKGRQSLAIYNPAEGGAAVRRIKHQASPLGLQVHPSCRCSHWMGPGPRSQHATS